MARTVADTERLTAIYSAIDLFLRITSPPDTDPDPNYTLFLTREADRIYHIINPILQAHNILDPVRLFCSMILPLHFYDNESFGDLSHPVTIIRAGGGDENASRAMRHNIVLRDNVDTYPRERDTFVLLNYNRTISKECIDQIAAAEAISLQALWRHPHFNWKTTPPFLHVIVPDTM